jgi:EAL domain-containing protein (putative c-di-GMP-specific phosphodiesterase class I)
VIKGEQVQMVYQPVLDLVERKVIGLEALTRVPRSRFPNPETLFKVAHQNNTLWTLERLCRNRALQGLPRLEDKQKLFLNVEPDSLHDPELLNQPFSDRLREAGLRPQQIVLEITERTSIQDFPMVRRMITRCRHQGYRVAMDDVGSGYAGLQAIAEIAPDYIKMDMSLVRNIHRNMIKRELVSTICRFSDSTGITLVAEGVETTEELQSLVAAGVRCAQGFLFCRPSKSPVEPDWDSILPPT